MERVILHCDCNCFFASVEAALNPELNKFPFAVCGDPEQRHGIVLAKNWENSKIIAIDKLGKDFLDTVKTGDTLEIKEDGSVIIK